MASGTFEQTSLDWQVQQLSQRFGEWFEGLFIRSGINKLDPQIPQLPVWVVQILFWLIGLGTVAWASWQLYQWLRPYFLAYWQSSRNAERLIVMASPQQTVAEWLQQARAAQQQGHYQEACRALYMATLQQLSDRGLITQEASRTDGEYLLLLQTMHLPQPYQTLIRTHERLCFDRVSVSANDYQQCWQAYQEIGRL